MAAHNTNAATDLDEIEKALQSLHLQSASSAQTAQAVSVLASASKHNTSARERLADATILRNLVEIVETSLSDSLETTDLALRCIGNASIDNNEARETLTNLGFSWALSCLRIADLNDVKTSLLAAKVLYNICCDYEPAQRKCFVEYAYQELIRLCTFNTMVESGDKTLLIELLFWICSHKQAESTTNDPLPGPTLLQLLTLPYFYNDNTDDAAMLLEICLLFLRDSETQKSVVTQKQASSVFQMLVQNETRIAQMVEGEEDQKLLVPLSISLIWCLSDMSALPEFSQAYDFSTDWVRYYIMDIISKARNLPTRVTTAACQILGNLFWTMSSPDDFAWLVQSQKLHEPLFASLAATRDTELDHAIAGLLIQLSRPVNVREDVGSDQNARHALDRLCRHEMPQLKQDGIKLLQALGRDCPANQERFADLALEVTQSGTQANTDMGEGSA